MSVPSAIHYPNLTEMLAARDALLTAWRNGIIDDQTCRKRLSSLSAPDADNNQWRLRPTQQGALFIRISPEGETAVVTLSDYTPPATPTPTYILVLKAATVLAYTALWIVVAIAYAQS